MKKDVQLICFGRAIRKLRKEKDLSLKQLAKKTGIKASTLSRAERGLSEMGFLSYLDLQLFFECDLKLKTDNEWMELQHKSALELVQE